MAQAGKIGLITSTALVVGNMIGAGIYVLPSALAEKGSISILGWIFTATGALILAKIFSNFSKIIVNKSGGPYAYSKEGFGDFIGFLVAWGYWISIWISNAAIAVAIISALSVFIPALETNPLLSVGTGLGFIWLFTWINSKGIPESGKVQVVTTIMKLLPLAVIILVGAFFFNLDNFPAFNLTGENDLVAFSLVAPLTLYAFLGLECATIPAENVENPDKTIPKATLLGTLISTLVYVLSTVVLFGVLPVDELINSPAPFAEAGKIIGGEYAEYFVAAGAAVSAIGALNGWILISGQIPMATAKDDLFPAVFKRTNKKGVPAIGLIIGSILTSAVMVMNYTGGLVEQFEFMVGLSVLACLVPYLFTAAAYPLVILDNKLNSHNFIKTLALGGLGFAYAVWAIFGTPPDTVFYGFLLLLLGIPFYVIGKWKTKNKQ